jgi:hypothetical protein
LGRNRRTHRFTRRNLDFFDFILNTIWAPNKVLGLHAIQPLEYLVNELKAVDAAGGGYDDVVKIIQKHGSDAAKR